MDKEAIRKLLNENIEFIKSLTTEEYTLYRNWSHKNTDRMKKWYKENKNSIEAVKRKIWIPKSIDDYQNLNIELIPADGDFSLTWRILREFIHTAVWHASPGRMARYIVAHSEKKKHPIAGKIKIYRYLGIISLGSDFISVGGRDNHIGWKMEDRIDNGRLKHTCMGSSIVPVQPLGYNYLGGKLISLMVCSDVAEKNWNSKYNETLAGITTTSLYGGYSQYNNLRHWKKCKSTEGKVTIEPSDHVYEKLRDWMKVNYPDDYPEDPPDGILSHTRNRIMTFLSKELGVKLPDSTFKRGVYWCELYKNTNEFLRCEQDALKEKKFDNRVEILSNLWKERYAKKRIQKLSKEGRISTERLFYDDLIDMSWEDAREKYIKNVGR